MPIFAFSSWLLSAANLSSRLVPAIAITAIFALWARWMKGVSPGGALAGFGVAFAIYLGAGLSGFAALFSVFLITAIATRWRRPVKERFGKRGQPNGRDGRQVLANLFAAAAIAIICVPYPKSYMYLMPGMIAALAEVAADTVSSETGEAIRGRTYMIIGFRRVEAGPDGGISLSGTLLGTLAALAVAIVGWFTGVLDIWWALVAAGCGVSGMIFDSVLGATLERRGLLDNNGVNFLGTIFAADLALLISWLLR
ncbi:MAG TPA: DUF92 domain-containing protein [Candidatus Koribacter sp.]